MFDIHPPEVRVKHFVGSQVSIRGQFPVGLDPSTIGHVQILLTLPDGIPLKNSSSVNPVFDEATVSYYPATKLELTSSGGVFSFNCSVNTSELEAKYGSLAENSALFIFRMRFGEQPLSSTASDTDKEKFLAERHLYEVGEWSAPHIIYTGVSAKIVKKEEINKLGFVGEIEISETIIEKVERVDLIIERADGHQDIAGKDIPLSRLSNKNLGFSYNIPFIREETQSSAALVVKITTNIRDFIETINAKETLSFQDNIVNHLFKDVAAFEVPMFGKELEVGGYSFAVKGELLSHEKVSDKKRYIDWYLIDKVTRLAKLIKTTENFAPSAETSDKRFFLETFRDYSFIDEGEIPEIAGVGRWKEDGKTEESFSIIYRTKTQNLYGFKSQFLENYVFLADDKRQLALRHSNIVSQVKLNTSENLIHTLGSPYPLLIKSGEKNYRSLQVKSIIHMDVDPVSLFTQVEVKNFEQEDREKRKLLKKFFDNKIPIERLYLWNPLNQNNSVYVSPKRSMIIGGIKFDLESPSPTQDEKKVTRFFLKEDSKKSVLEKAKEINLSKALVNIRQKTKQGLLSGPTTKVSVEGFEDTIKFSDPRYQFTIERLFKEDVVSWLTNGEPKLFRSAIEGRFIGILTEVALTPFNGSRTVYEASFTFIETAELTTQNMFAYKIYPFDLNMYYPESLCPYTNEGGDFTGE